MDPPEQDTLRLDGAVQNQKMLSHGSMAAIPRCRCNKGLKGRIREALSRIADRCGIGLTQRIERHIRQSRTAILSTTSTS
eukprot:scaffold10870_cov84-Cyclotella_meneghiniana.AAC.4